MYVSASGGGRNFSFLENFAYFLHGWHSVHPRFYWGKVHLPPKFQEGEGLDRISIFKKQIDGKEGVAFFIGGSSF